MSNIHQVRYLERQNRHSHQQRAVRIRSHSHAVNFDRLLQHQYDPIEFAKNRDLFNTNVAETTWDMKHNAELPVSMRQSAEGYYGRPQLTVPLGKYAYDGDFRDHSTLEGSGIIDDIKHIFNQTSKLNNISTKTLKEHGNETITHLDVFRTPIRVNGVLNAISLGAFNREKQKAGFDKFFHLALVATVTSGTRIIIEKNEVINVSTSYKISPQTQVKNIHLEGKHLTPDMLMEGGLKRMGDALFYRYDAFQNNCQDFIKAILSAAGLYTADVDKFVYQDAKSVAKNIPSFTKKFANATTRLGGIFPRLLGKGVSGGYIPTSDEIDNGLAQWLNLVNNPTPQHQLEIQQNVQAIEPEHQWLFQYTDHIHDPNTKLLTILIGDYIIMSGDVPEQDLYILSNGIYGADDFDFPLTPAMVSQARREFIKKILSVVANEGINVAPQDNTEEQEFNQ